MDWAQLLVCHAIGWMKRGVEGEWGEKYEESTGKVREEMGEDKDESVRVVVEHKVDSVAALNHLKHMNR